MIYTPIQRNDKLLNRSCFFNKYGARNFQYLSRGCCPKIWVRMTRTIKIISLLRHDLIKFIRTEQCYKVRNIRFITYINLPARICSKHRIAGSITSSFDACSSCVSLAFSSTCPFLLAEFEPPLVWKPPFLRIPPQVLNLPLVCCTENGISLSHKVALIFTSIACFRKIFTLRVFICKNSFILELHSFMPFLLFH